MKTISHKVEKESVEWVKELERLGYKGKLLTMLVDTIGNEANLGTFYQFVLDNDGKCNSKLSLVSRFVVYMQEKQSYQNATDFTQEYIASTDIDNKKYVLEKLFGCNVDFTTLNKVLQLLEKHTLTLERLYELVSHYRKSYNPKETVTLIEYKFGK